MRSDLVIYLAGSIRDDKPADIEWREQVITAMQDLPVTFLNPLGGKQYDAATRIWTMGTTHQASATMIVKQDFWCVDRSDIVIFNFIALAEGYPNIGTLVEFGRATKAGALIYSIIPKEYTGHENPTMYRLHPFLEQNSAGIFHGVEECVEFLQVQLSVLTGLKPRYGGTINGTGNRQAEVAEGGRCSPICVAPSE